MHDAIYGAALKPKLSNPAAAGAPEDQLRAPLETLLRELASAAGIRQDHVALVGESTISEMHTRPDYAVTLRNTLVGFIEIKAPGKGAAEIRGVSPIRTTGGSGPS